MNRVLCLDTESRLTTLPDCPSDRDQGHDAQAFLIRLCDRIGAWQERAASRRALARLDERLLRDIGLDPAAAADEAAKPFWRA
jgi:uncharacterized protein YjiS (DUF1127 family)